MAKNVLVDSGFLVALLNSRDADHEWAHAIAKRYPPPWMTCDAALSEAFYLISPNGPSQLAELIKRGALSSTFRLNDSVFEVLQLMLKYENVPMAFADACLVRMSEIFSDPIVLTTDSDFHVYRRLGRQAVPCVMPA
ncbi:MAG: type II toxin-antitoxin system VapC family toxin [Pseudomonadota bacterium]